MVRKNNVVNVVLSVDERNRLASFVSLLIVIHKRAPARGKRASKKVSEAKPPAVALKALWRGVTTKL